MPLIRFRDLEDARANISTGRPSQWAIDRYEAMEAQFQAEAPMRYTLAALRNRKYYRQDTRDSLRWLAPDGTILADFIAACKHAGVEVPPVTPVRAKTPREEIAELRAAVSLLHAEVVALRADVVRLKTVQAERCEHKSVKRGADSTIECCHCGARRKVNADISTPRGPWRPEGEEL